jgi:hypothetical protein
MSDKPGDKPSKTRAATRARAEETPEMEAKDPSGDPPAWMASMLQMQTAMWERIEKQRR